MNFLVCCEYSTYYTARLECALLLLLAAGTSLIQKYLSLQRAGEQVHSEDSEEAKSNSRNPSTDYLVHLKTEAGGKPSSGHKEAP